MEYPASVFDVEVSPPFAMLGLLDMLDGAIRQFTSEPGLGETFAQLRAYWRQARHERLWIGFNNLLYDNHILRAILHGQDDPAELYKLSVARISDQEEWLSKVDQIDGEVSVDLYQLHARLGSLKEIGIKLGYPVLQELPYAFDVAAMSHEQMLEVMRYNAHDLRITALAAAASVDQIAQRIELSAQMGVRVVNKHDAGVAEAIMAHQLFGAQKRDYPTATSWSLSGKDLIKPFGFVHPALQELAARIGQWDLRMQMTETEDD